MNALRVVLARFYTEDGRMIRSELAGRTQFCVHTSKGPKGDRTKRSLFTNSKLHKTRLNNKLVGRTLLDKTQRTFGLLTDYSFKNDELQFVNIYLCHKFAILRSVDLLYFVLNCITDTIQAAQGCK